MSEPLRLADRPPPCDTKGFLMSEEREEYILDPARHQSRKVRASANDDEYPVGHPRRYQNPSVGFRSGLSDFESQQQQQKGEAAHDVPGVDHRYAPEENEENEKVCASAHEEEGYYRRHPEEAPRFRHPSPVGPTAAAVSQGYEERLKILQETIAALKAELRAAGAEIIRLQRALEEGEGGE